MTTSVPFQQIRITRIDLQYQQHPDPSQRGWYAHDDFAATSARLREWVLTVRDKWERIEWRIVFNDGTDYRGVYFLHPDDSTDLIGRAFYTLALDWRKRQDEMTPDGI